jgi:hypothetical protein
MDGWFIHVSINDHELERVLHLRLDDQSQDIVGL